MTSCPPYRVPAAGVPGGGCRAPIDLALLVTGPLSRSPCAAEASRVPLSLVRGRRRRCLAHLATYIRAEFGLDEHRRRRESRVLRKARAGVYPSMQSNRLCQRNMGVSFGPVLALSVFVCCAVRASAGVALWPRRPTSGDCERCGHAHNPPRTR